MIAIVHSIYSQSVHAPASHARLMDNEAERYCSLKHNINPSHNILIKQSKLCH